MNDIEEGNVGILTITEPLSDKDKIKVSYGLIGDSIRVELDLEKSLVAYYKFDSNARDDVGGNHGTPVGDVTYVNDADRGMVASFDGYADYIDLGFPDDFDYITGMPGNGNALTVTAWVKANSFAGTNYKGIITNSVSGANNADIRFALMHYDVNSVNSLRIDWGDTTGKDSYRTVDNSFDQLDKWYHIAVTVSSGGEIKLYLDGNQNGIIGTTTRDLPESTKSWRIGTNYGAVDDIEPEYSWNGYIDEVRFYKRVLSPVEIKILASQ